jgi:hypothetical protein
MAVIVPVFIKNHNFSTVQGEDQLHRISANQSRNVESMGRNSCTTLSNISLSLGWFSWNLA